MPLIRVNGTVLNYRFDGPDKGPVVMFSNSLASDLSMWDAQVSLLVQTGYRVLRYDSRGHGRSEVPAGPYSIELLADDAVGLIDALGLEKVHFCGLSMGGMVGQVLGARHSDRLLSLVLSSTAAHLPHRENWDERIRTVKEKGMDGVINATIDRWFTKTGQERLHAEVTHVKTMILNTPVEGFCACCTALQNMDLRDLIQPISKRTLVIVGEHDPGTPVSAARFIQGQITASKLMVITAAAHFANVEQSGTFNKALLNFVETTVT